MRDLDSGFSMELREPVVLMLREIFKWGDHKSKSTDAEHWGGATRSSVESPVMGVERRGRVRSPDRHPTVSAGGGV